MYRVHNLDFLWNNTSIFLRYHVLGTLEARRTECSRIDTRIRHPSPKPFTLKPSIFRSSGS